MAHPPTYGFHINKLSALTVILIRQKEINFPFRHLIRHTNPSKSFLKPASSRFRPKNHSYLRKMSILPDCRVFDYSANFSTHDSTVPNKTPRGIPMVLCVRSSVRDCGRVRLCGISEPWTFGEINKKPIKYSFLVFLRRIKCSVLLFYYKCAIVLKACLLLLTSLPPHNTTSYQ